jgi:hypothetical protein
MIGKPEAKVRITAHLPASDEAFEHPVHALSERPASCANGQCVVAALIQ